nr:hypothetical protein [Tanacetum cinerariifolium]
MLSLEPNYLIRFLNKRIQLKGFPKIDEPHALSKPVTSNSTPTPQESNVVRNDNVIALGIFKINPFKPSKEEKYVPNKVKASVKTNLITVSQPHVITKKMLILTQMNVKSKVVCAMYKKCLISANHDVCLLNYVNDMNSHGKKQKANVSINKNQKKQTPKVKKPKNVWSNERLASPKLSKPRSFLRWLPIGRLFDLKGKIIASSESESQSDSSNGDNACTSNPSEPTIKRFPNSTSFLGRSKDEAPKVIKTFLKRINVHLQSPFIIIRTENGTKFKTQVLKEYFDSVGISHQVSSVRTPQQNGVVERRNRTLVEAARTIFYKTPYELINGKKLDITFLHVFEALYYPKNDREDIRKLGAKGDIGLFIGYSADSCELDLLFEAMYDDHFGGQPSTAPGTASAAQVPQVLQTPMVTTTTADTVPTPTNLSSQATNFPNNSQDVDGLDTQQQHAQQQENVPLQPEIVADNVSNAMFDDNTFVNPFATPSISFNIHKFISQRNQQFGC